MTIGCDHPRPKLNMPGYTPVRLAWKPPAVIPTDPAGMARVLLEAFRGLGAALQEIGQKRTIVPLLDDIDARAGQVIVGVGNGQVIRLPPPAPGDLGQVGIVLTDVVTPITVVNPDGTTTSLGTAGAYDFVGASPEIYSTNPGGTVLSGSVPTDRLLGRDAAGTGASEFIAATGGLEFSGSQSIRVADDGISNAKLRNSTALSVIGRSTSSTGDPADISATGRRQFVATDAAGTGVSFQTLSAIFPGGPVYDVMAYPFNATGSLAGDDTAALNAAIAAANAAPGIIYLGPAHRITAGLDPITNNNIRLLGRGEFNGGTILQVDSAAAVDAITVSGCQYVGVERMWITGTRVFTSGWGIRFEGCFRCYTDRVIISTMCFGVEHLNNTLCEVRRTNIGDLYGVYGFLARGSGGNFNHAVRYECCVGGTNYPATVVGAATVWAASTAYIVGNIVFANNNIYQCVQAGTSGASAPSGSGTTALNAHTTQITDGTVRWVFAMPLNVWFCQESGSQTFEVIDCGTLQGGWGLLVDDSTASTPLFTRVQNLQIDHPFTAGVQLNAGFAARMNQIFVTSVLEGSGIIVSSGYGGGWEFIGGEVFGTAKAGMTIAKGDGVIDGVTFASIGLATVNTRDCIEVAASVSRFTIADCHMGTASGATDGHRYGISVAAGADNYVIVGNRCIGGLTGGILNTPGTASTRVVHDNIPNTTDGILVKANGAGPAYWTAFDFDDTASIDFSFANNGGGELNISADWLGIIVKANGSGPVRWTAFDFDDTATVDFTFANNGSGELNITADVPNDAITFAKMQNVGYGVIGNPTFATTVDPVLIAPPGSNTILQDNGSGTLAFRSLATTSIVHGALGVFERAALTGDVTASQNSNATTIASNAVTNTQAADMAAHTVKVRVGATTGDPSDLAISTDSFLSRIGSANLASHAFSTLAGAGLTYATGTLTWAGLTIKANGAGPLAWTSLDIDDSTTIDFSFANNGGGELNVTAGVIADSISNTLLANMATARLKGRTTAATGDPEDLTLTNSTTVTWNVATGGAIAVERAALTGSVVATANSNATLFRGMAANTSLLPTREFYNWIAGSHTTITGTSNATDILMSADVNLATLVPAIDSASVIANGTVLERAALTGDVTATQNSNATTIAANAVTTAKILDANVTLAKMANLAQSTIVGRAEGAGTGVPTALTPTQVIAIVDAESPTWTGSHTFNGTNQTITPSANIVLTAGANVTISATGVVSIPSPSELGSPTLTGAVFQTSVLSSTMTGDINNLAIGTVSIVRLDVNSAADRSLTGMVPQSNGQVVHIFNTATTAGRLLIANDTGSTAANRFLAPGTNHAIRPRGGVTAWYDSTSSRWRILVDSETDLI